VNGLGSSSSLNTSSLPIPESGWTPSPTGPKTTLPPASLTVIRELTFETVKSCALMYVSSPVLPDWTLIHQSPAAGS
jgi:hypothetical protein